MMGVIFNQPFRSSRLRHGPRLGAIALMAALAMASPLAFGQFGLPPEIVGSQSQLNDEQKAAVLAHITAQTAKVDSGDAAKVMSGREELLRPLDMSASPSVPFRLNYSEQLEPKLKKLIETGNELQQVNAMTIAGHLCTGRAPALIALGRNSKTASVRFQAAAATRQTFADLAGVQTPAINDTDLTKLLDDTTAAIAKEQDSFVVGEQIAALSAGLSLPSVTVRTKASERLADAINQVTKSAGQKPLAPATLSALERAMGQLKDQIIAAGNNVSSSLSKGAADAALSALMQAKAAIKAQKVPAASSATEAGRTEYANIAGQAETLLQLAGQVSKPPVNVPGAGLKASVNANTAAKDAEAVQGFDALLNQAGAFGLDAARYK